MPTRSKGKASLKRALAKAIRNQASRSLKGQFVFMLQEEKLLSRYRESWLAEKSAEELDYPVFFAVSEKGGKNNSGDSIYKKDENGELAIDSHGHLIVENDLDEIAEAFILYAKKQGFEFYKEG